ncbi:hypothetical protein CYLTODRAFT_408767 [Cylindrobasidium torrendii FP15055 ss-10]|uniref:Arrestin C-terminal-like domain-containing protein n=1 Tax=Cylindrobasidium torrendii FP15055 ss-10 TaxID=1314674 RepID=A0A0D7BIZ5_9AGAR|nr:hypothetical protein CYLTODRAFT_408767 [Cylindrobasidium torrendii FP15055 ss-10]
MAPSIRELTDAVREVVLGSDPSEELTPRLIAERVQQRFKLDNNLLEKGSETRDPVKEAIKAANEERTAQDAEKAEAKDESPTENPPPSPPTAASKGKKKAEKDESDVEMDKPELAKPSSSKKAAKKSKTAASDSDGESKKKAKPTPRRSSTKKQFKSASVIATSESEGDGERPAKPKHKPEASKPKPAPKPKAKPKKETPAVESDAEESGPEEDAPKKRKRKSDSASKPPAKKRAKKEVNKDEETLKKLKSYVSACGVRKPWKTLFKDADTASRQIPIVQNVLRELGMTGRFSLEQAKRIKEKRELEEDVAEAQVFEQRTRGSRREQRSEPSPDEANSEPADDEDAEAQPKFKRSGANICDGPVGARQVKVFEGEGAVGHVTYTLISPPTIYGFVPILEECRSTLRQPPNVEFVHGYPGIPSGGPDRPQAAVKGAVEVRATSPAGVRSKWLRVELRKVETIPGSGSNTFYDYVGPSPVDIWRAEDEWDLLSARDIPFEIRIPESIPPTLQLDDNVGIRYELIASICTKGKRSFFRKQKSNVVSAQTEIIIDKHDLHATWPVYNQPDVRQVDLDGVVLTVERHHTCYAPGDTVTAIATVRSEFQTVILRGFEMSLRETRTFRGGAYVQGKKTVPQTRVSNLVDVKVPVNLTLMGGMQHKSELGVNIPPNHTTTTLNSARHIDITYVLCVRAIMGTGQPVICELPVIMSNWPRTVSHEAVRRIGPAPGLSLLAANAMHSVVSSAPEPPRSNTFAGRPSALEVSRNAPNSMTSPTSPQRGLEPNEFGAIPRLTHHSRPSEERRLTITNAQPNEISQVDPMDARRRPSANVHPVPSNGYRDEKAEYQRAKDSVERVQGNHSPPPSRDGPAAGSSHRPWVSAEEEKIRLYNRAQDAVNRTQGSEVARPGMTSPVNGAVDEKEALRKYNEARRAVDRAQNSILDGELPVFEGGSSSGPSVYATAAEEKERLRRDMMGQGSGSSSPPLSSATPYESAAAEKARLKREMLERERGGRSNSPPSMGSSSIPNGSGSGAFESAAAEKARLKMEMQARERIGSVPSHGHQPPKMPSPQLPNGNGSVPGSPFESAAAEKARMKREMIERDRQEQERLQRARSANSTASSPYESAAAEKARMRREMEERDRQAQAMPPPFSSGSSSSYTNAYSSSASPPPIAGGSPYESAAAEKARLRRELEERDRQPPSFTASSSLSPSPPPFASGSSPLPPFNGNGLSEKEIMARHFASQDAMAGSSSRPQPATPGPAGMMSAAQEKQMLAARFAAEDATPRTPPPLAPRPPKDYIRETQDEDLRVSKYVYEDAPIPDVEAPPPLPPKPE